MGAGGVGALDGGDPTEAADTTERSAVVNQFMVLSTELSDATLPVHAGRAAKRPPL